MYRLLAINALAAAVIDAGAQDVVANYSSWSIDLVVLVTAAVVCVCTFTL